MSHISKLWFAVGVMQLISMGSISSSSAQAPRTKQTTVNAAPKPTLDDDYQRRFVIYNEKINQGLAKGWLTENQASSFQAKLALIRTMEVNDSHRSFDPKHTYYLNRRIIKFQNDLVAAERKGPMPNTKVISPTPESGN
ncbi:hypothetical protein BH10CYA1_BH10CYA1_56000 [soil metagenome]